MPYRSRLSAVLFQRKVHEEDASREFVTAKNLLIGKQEQLRLLDIKLQSTLDDLTRMQENGGNAEEIALYFRFIENLQERVKKQEKAVFSQDAVCEAKRVLLTVAVKERKAVESIEKKREEAYFKEVTKKEQAILDEIGGQLKRRTHV